jgi:beta-glucanase (GH16 family)
MQPSRPEDVVAEAKPAAEPPPAPPAAPPAAPREEWTLVWQDEFDAAEIDRAKWSHVVAGGGFGNNERQFYTDDRRNSWVEKGRLIIEARQQERDGHAYTSAKIHTQGKGDWQYGRFEIRAKLPEGRGIWPAIWMMPSDYHRYGGWPVCGEIDIVELVGHEPGTVHGTLHYGHPWKNVGQHTVLPAGRKFSEDFHLFTLEWGPGFMKWFLDGQLYQTQDDWYTSHPGARWPAPFDQKFYLQLNVAVGGNWPGYPDASTKFPQRLEVDYVRVYRFNGEYPVVEDRSAAPPLARKRAPLPDGNHIYNGDFAAGTREWRLQCQEGAQATQRVAGGVMRIEVAQAGPSKAAVRVSQNPLNLERGKAYRVEFDAWADTARAVEVFLGKASQHWDNYSGERDVRIGTERARHGFTFKMRRGDDPVARLVFGLGDQAGAVSVSSVKLVQTNAEVATMLDGATRLEAEEFDRSQGGQPQGCFEGGENMGWIEAGTWLEYLVESPRAARYRLELRYASLKGGRAVVKSGETVVAHVVLPGTGDWQKWQTLSSVVQLPPGRQTLRIECTEAGYNLNWLRLTPAP